MKEAFCSVIFGGPSRLKSSLYVKTIFLSYQIQKGQGWSSVRKKRFGTEECFICLKCTNMTAFDNLGQSAHLSSLKEEYCLHAKLCSVIFDGRGEEIFDIPENGFVDVLKQEKEFIGLVHAPPNLQKKYPGIIVLNSRTTNKQKCHTCEGNKCVHINTYQSISSKRIICPSI